MSPFSHVRPCRRIAAGLFALAATLPPPALAQTTFVPSAVSPFGKPSLSAIPQTPVEKPDLPGPTDLPDTGTGDKTAARGAKAADVDLAFGAYQRGFYSTAMRETMKRLGGNPHDGAAMTLAGELYAQGLGVREDKAEAARWYALGAEAGDPQAMFELAIARMRGEGVAKDRDGAKAMFMAAAAHDNAGALFYLGLIALQGNGVAPDSRTAASYFQRSADLGSSEGQYALGLMYRQGNGVDRDDARAATLIRDAADNDNIAAMVEYGIMAFNGIGGAKDEALAARYFIKAAGRNNPVAQDRAARLYVAGRGVRKDLVEGMKWHVLATSAGLKDEWLDDEMRKLTPEQREAVDRAVRHYVGS